MNHFGSLAGDCCCWRVCCWISLAKASMGSKWEVETTITPVWSMKIAARLSWSALTREIVFQELMIAAVDDAKETVAPSIEPRGCRCACRTRSNQKRCPASVSLYFWCATDTARYRLPVLDWRFHSSGRWQRNRWGAFSPTYSVEAHCWNPWFPDVSFSAWSDCSLDLDSWLKQRELKSSRWRRKSYLRMEDDRRAELTRQKWDCFFDKCFPRHSCRERQWSDKTRLE